ncbi:hypothetical protein [Gordonia sp. (in: high G+C Gram-positive bacteria)]|uniref:hypothetical protein n=1 Tax=Gordonia sp. (in: high G+C Gram-positive bacteria) TaxID=84139 RepID=UPI0016BB5A71|nr:hypothetical protein [Gordonia sp. (in: high G+C Gram-positive bacteria)]NLG45100.1 hypothetical protein [Gordonia sp. (in: high G+C Gram-positive bacteria)]
MTDPASSAPAPSSSAPRLLPAAFNALLCIVGGFATGLATAVPVWFALRLGWRYGWGPDAPGWTHPDWLYPGVCGVLVAAAVALTALRLRGVTLVLALLFASGVALGCTVPPLVAYLVAAV